MQRPLANQGPRGLVDIVEDVDLPRNMAKVGFAGWLLGILGRSDLGDCLGWTVTKVYICVRLMA